MGKQCTKAIFVGTCANLNGYVDDGKPVARLVDRKDRRQAGAKAASKAFGKVSKAAAKLWGRIPQGMRRLGGEGAFNEWVSACHGLRNEGSYHWDWEQLEGMAFGDAATAGGSGSPNSLRCFGTELEGSEGIRCWEAPSRAATVAGIRRGKLDFTGALASVRRALKPYREGVDAQWRLGAMPRRDGHYDLGTKFNPHRGAAFRYEGDARDRAWNEKHAKGVFKGAESEYFDHGWGLAEGRLGRGHTVWGDWGGVDGPRMPKRWENFRVPNWKRVALASRKAGHELESAFGFEPRVGFRQKTEPRVRNGPPQAAGKGVFRVRFWLQVVDVDGRMLPWACTDWCNLDAGDRSGSGDQARHGVPALDLDLTDLREKLAVLDCNEERSLGFARDVLVFVGVEVSEKRVRHWVRLPWACGLSLVAVGSVAELREKVAVGRQLRGRLAVRRQRLGRLAVRGIGIGHATCRHGCTNRRRTFLHRSGP